MDLQTEKKQIIEALQQRNEEWLIIAIKKLLDLDTYSLSTEHRLIIEERTERYNNNPDDLITSEQLQKDLEEEGKL